MHFSRTILSLSLSLSLTHSHTHTPDQVLESYSWHKPGNSITERKKQTDRRREELLSLLYQDSINTSMYEGLD